MAFYLNEVYDNISDENTECEEALDRNGYHIHIDDELHKQDSST